MHCFFSPKLGRDSIFKDLKATTSVAADDISPDNRSQVSRVGKITVLLAQLF